LGASGGRGAARRHAQISGGSFNAHGMLLMPIAGHIGAATISNC